MNKGTEAPAGNISASLYIPASGVSPAVWGVPASLPQGQPGTHLKGVPPGTPGTHLKEALPLAQAAPLQVPKVNVGFPTGDEHGGICGVEGSHQHGLVGAL